MQKSINSSAQGGVLAAGDGDESTYARALMEKTSPRFFWGCFLFKNFFSVELKIGMLIVSRTENADSLSYYQRKSASKKVWSGRGSRISLGVLFPLKSNSARKFRVDFVLIEI